jgi:hypothetical protein
MKAKITKLVIALTGAGATSAYAAATNSATEGSGLLVWFLIGFGVLVVMLQAVPALVMFVSMLKGLFGSTDKPATLPKG